MKKILYALIAAAMSLTGCSRSDNPLDTDPCAQPTTFTLALDGAMTRAASTTEITPTRYVMEVWSEDGTQPENVFEDGTKNRAEATSGSFIVVLDQTKAYTCLFWADDNGTTYDAASLKAVALKAGQAVTEAYHATTAVAAGKNPAVTITLKRAVAKVTLEETAALEAGKTLAATYKQLTQFDVLAGKAIGTLEDKTTIITLAADALTGKVAQFYLLATTEQSLTDFSFVYNGEEAKRVTNVPVQQNYITNIKGAYSSLGSFTFDISAGDAWESPDNEVVIEPKNIISNNTEAKAPEKGDGSKENPYLIESGSNIKWMQNLTYTSSKDKYYKLTTDIKVIADTWKPIGLGDTFYGHFDGDNHTITGKLTAASDFVGYNFGFFGKVNSPGSIRNLTNSAEVYAPNVVNVGGVTGSTSGGEVQVMITDCANTAKITGKYNVAGIAGSYFFAKDVITSGEHLFMSDCHNSGEIIALESADQYETSAAGIVASLYLQPANGVANDQVTYLLENCTNSGNVSAPSKAKTYVGGIVGLPQITRGTFKIKGCTNSGTIKSGDVVAIASEGTPATSIPGLILGGQYTGYNGVAVIE